MTQIVVNPFQAIPIIDDLGIAAVRKLSGQKVWKVFNTPLFDDLESGWKFLKKKNPNAADFFELFATSAEVTTKAPVKVISRIIQNMIKGKRGGATEVNKQKFKQRQHQKKILKKQKDSRKKILEKQKEARKRYKKAKR